MIDWSVEGRSWVGFTRAALNLFGFADARAVLDDGVEVAGLVLDAVVVVVQVVDVVHVVVVEVGSLQGLAATEVLLTAEGILVLSWLVLFGVDGDLGGSAAERSDLRGLGGA